MYTTEGRTPPLVDVAGVRPEIAASWWRSKLLGVKPELGIEAIPTAELVDTDERLRRAVQPVLDELATNLDRTTSAILLADHRAVIIDRRATSRSLEQTLDSFAVMPGYDFGEAAIGTNGIGTAAEERRMVRVAGAEHYAHLLHRFSCYGRPLVHPLTRRLVGVLNLAFPPDEEHPLMESFMADAGRRVEGVLAEWASLRQRAQFDRFLTLGRQRGKPVLSVMDDAVILNAAARQLDPAHQAELLCAAEEAGTGSGDEEMLINLTGEEDPVSVRLHTHSDEVRFPGVVLELVPTTRRRARPTNISQPLAGLVGRSAAWVAFCTEASQVALKGVPIVISGEPGAGKLAVAQALHALAGGTKVTVLDAASVPTDGKLAWLRALRQHLDDPECSVILRHLELCETAVSAAIAAEIDRVDVSPVYATCAQGVPKELDPLLARFHIHLQVPPLRERRDDIPPLVSAFIARHAQALSLRIHPSTMSALIRAEFSDNVRGLENVIRELAARGRTGDVLPSDLPTIGPQGPSHLTQIEQAERSVILKALQRANGNKAAAAVDLGISRPTLYRKLTIYKIDAPSGGVPACHISLRQ